MKYLDEFRDKRLSEGLTRKIREISAEKLNLMEVCGTHTVTILRNGIKELLKDEVNLISGPGCPVCVTSNADIDTAIAMARLDDLILVTFGDMIKVPGTSSSLQKERADGRDIRVVYSPMDAVRIAGENPQKTVVFLAIGFETTAPTIASSVVEAYKNAVENFFILSVHKLIPPAMSALLNMGEVNIHGFICPGHVSAVIGSIPYRFIAEDYKIPCAITGFEPLDVLMAIYMLLVQNNNKESKVEIQYSRGVPEQGNPAALNVLNEVFETCDTTWRGLGLIPSSGLKLRDKYEMFDARKRVKIPKVESREHPGCICGEILRGIKNPSECKLFGDKCTPEYPVGACMVSGEGTCAAHYRYDNSLTK